VDFMPGGFEALLGGARGEIIVHDREADRPEMIEARFPPRAHFIGIDPRAGAAACGQEDRNAEENKRDFSHGVL
jgi:hypothetical protein